MTEPTHQRRWLLIRNSLAFQFKLLVDGIRDFLLVPATIFATLLGLLTRPSEPEYYFEKVLNWGRDSESYINLFGDKPKPDQGSQIDDLVSHAENKIKNEYEKGGLTTSAKDVIDRGLDRLNQDADK